MAKDQVVVAGLGEVGRPLLEIIREKHNAVGIDIEPVAPLETCAVLHICYPFSKKFVDTTVDYIRSHGPSLAIINSTVAPGTTREIHRRAGISIAYSPIRGKHARMKEDLLYYTKFIGGVDRASARLAQDHFESMGFKTKLVGSPEAAELAKLTETTYFGVLIAWAQEVERYSEQFHANYDDVVSFYEEIAFLPRVKYFPGVIGGHCVMPNIEILRTIFDSDILEAIVSSNARKIREVQLESVPA